MALGMQRLAELARGAVTRRGSNRPTDSLDTEQLKVQVIEALRQVRDPEIPLNIYDLGLIYRLEVNGSGSLEIDMTLTAPACPVAELMPKVVKRAVERVPGVKDVTIAMVWDPPWSKARISEAARLELGLL